MSIGQVLETPAMRAMIRERDEATAELDRGGRAGVTVCVPCFNQADTIGDTLDSIIVQTVEPLECIVIDDGSSDDVRGPVRARMGSSSTEFRYVRVTNRGLPNARNAALMLARGEWFLPVDSDDWLEPTYVEKTLERARETGADVVLTGIQEHGEHRNGRYQPGFDRPWGDVTVELLLNDYNRFFYCSLFRTRVLREIGGYNGRMVKGFEDWDMWIDLLKRGTVFCATNEPLFNYRTRAGSMLATAMAEREQIIAEMRRHHR